MNTAVVINHFDELGPRQTTTLLIGALLKAGHHVFLMNVDAFPNQNSPRIADLQIQATPLHEHNGTFDPEAIVAATQQTSSQPYRIATSDLILIRTNPGRDVAHHDRHQQFLQHAMAIESSGVRVVNSPRNLSRMANKAALQELDPRYVPRSLISDDPRRIDSFIRDMAAPCVVKPLVGSRGRDVIRVSPDQSELETILDAAITRGPVIVQEFVVDDQPGDIRVVCVGGRVLELSGHTAAIRRTPAAGDFRGNLHTGGAAHPIELTPATVLAANHAAQFLDNHGIWLAGIDIVGDKIIELNVFSTGGLFDAQRFAKQNFCDEIVTRLSTPDRSVSS